MGKDGPPHRFILLPAGSLSLPLPRLPPKPGPQDTPWRRAGEEPTETTKHREEGHEL